MFKAFKITLGIIAALVLAWLAGIAILLAVVAARSV